MPEYSSDSPLLPALDADNLSDSAREADGLELLQGLPEPAVFPALALTLPPARRRAAWIWLTASVVVAVALAFGLGYAWNRSSQAQTIARARQLESQVAFLVAEEHTVAAREKLNELKQFLSRQQPLPIELIDLADEVRRAEAIVSRIESRPDRKEPADVSSSPVPVPVPSTPEASPQPPVTRPAVYALPPLPDIRAPELSPPEPLEFQRPKAPAIHRPPVQPVGIVSDQLTDQEIGKAIDRGVNHLLGQFDGNTHLLSGVGRDRTGVGIGSDVLCVYAIMQCEQATGDARLSPHQPLMKGLIEAMKRLTVTGYPYETYARGLRATALAMYNRPEDRAVLRQDASALVAGTHGGAYTYTLEHGGPKDDGTGDNSNSQYGLLGVWSAAEVGFEVSSTYWTMVQRHWTQSQFANGQWAYYPLPGLEGTHSMTCAGLASLLVTHDYLVLPRFTAAVGRQPFTPELTRGFGWLEAGDHCIDLDHGAYDLYGLERVGLASGFKYFGEHDWYRELAARMIAMQQADGSWGDSVETAYTLLFLSRGRHPILMNKIRFNGYWANRPRDVANLARFVSHQLERQVNWQVVPVSRPWTDWTDAPILYLASHKAPVLTERNCGQIRDFVYHGGLLFTQADGDAPEFNQFAQRTARRLFPDYEMTDLPAAHPLRNVLFKIQPSMNLKIVSNGSRILMLHSSVDLSRYWQLRDDKYAPAPFQLGTNLFVYATGKRDLHNRLVTSYIPPVRASPSAGFRLARLTYPGNWNPEPAAWEQFSRWFQLDTGYALETSEVPLRELLPDTVPIAHLTGTARYDLTSDEVAAMKIYVEAGGVLLVENCGGTGTFDAGLKESLARAFSDHPMHPLSPTHAIFQPDDQGMDDLRKPRLRIFAVDAIGPAGQHIEEITAGRGRVIFTSLDVTSGLLGAETWGILGFDPAYARSLVKNLILWTTDGQRDSTSAKGR